MNPTLYSALTLIVPLVIAIVFHEVAHGWVALMLGDPTAREQHRLTLNPLRHVDPVGTIVLPGILALTHLPVFGWAKPVPVDARRLPHPRRDMLLIGAAGPAMNFFLALLAAIGLGLLVRSLGESAALSGNFWGDNLINFLQINLSLALFNLLPIPPFDGSHIVEGLLPTRLADAYSRMRRYGLILMLLLLLVVPQITGFSVVGRLIGPPFSWLMAHYLMIGDWVTRL